MAALTIADAITEPSPCSQSAVLVGRLLAAGRGAALILVSIGVVGCLMLPFGASAADFTVSDGQTVGAQTLAGSGDRGIVEAGGTISTTANSDHAVNMNVAGQELQNSGEILTTGNGAHGVRADFEAATIKNRGAIATTGDGSHGIASTGVAGIYTGLPNAEITNGGTISTTGTGSHGIISTDISALINSSGEISTTGNAAHGISSTGYNATITNSGTVTTMGDASHGIASTGVSGVIVNVPNAQITNNGVISTHGTASHGVFSTDVIAVITNNGAISTKGGSGDGIHSTGSGATINNSGTISVTGANAVGIRSLGANGKVTNSGRVVSSESNAIEFSGAENNTLTLLSGSSVQGGIVFGGGTDTLEIGEGLSISATFDKAPEVINAEGAIVAVSGTQVVTVDAADLGALAAQDEQLADFTGSLSSLLENRRSGLRDNAGASERIAANQTASLQSEAGEHTFAQPAHPVWIQSFGSYRRQESDGLAAETEQWQGGVAVGADSPYADDLRIGVFAGAAWGRVDAVEGSQEAETRSYFLGVYGSHERAGFLIDLAVSGGYSDFDQHRDVANNLVSGGLERAKADYGGWFVSPEVTVTRPMVLLDHPLEPGLTLRYAGLYLDDYTEEGAAAPLSVDSRELHIGIARLQVAAPKAIDFEGGDVIRYRLKAGAELRRRFGEDSIDGVLLGRGVSFDADEDDSSLGGFAGLSGEYDSGHGVIFLIGAEGLVETDRSYQFSAQAGLKFKL